MTIYIGNSDKLKINVNGSFCSLIIPPTLPTVVNNRLLSSDNYILQDSAGVYLVEKEND